jgi:hypothetical protein
MAALSSGPELPAAPERTAIAIPARGTADIKQIEVMFTDVVGCEEREEQVQARGCKDVQSRCRLQFV